MKQNNEVFPFRVYLCKKRNYKIPSNSPTLDASICCKVAPKRNDKKIREKNWGKSQG